jgi:F-type H+-transporting ATPase subunit alpha
MKRMGGKLRLDLSQYRELAVFARFGSDLDAQTTLQLERGKRIVEVLKQDLHSALAPEIQAVILHVATKDLLTDIPLNKLRAKIAEFIENIKLQHPDIIERVALDGKISTLDGVTIEDAFLGHDGQSDGN